MMKKKWNRAGILLLIFSVLLTGYTPNTAAALTPFQAAEMAKGKAVGVPPLSEKTDQTVTNTEPESTLRPEVTPNPTVTPEPVITPEPTEAPHDDISLVKVENYTSTTLTLSWFSDGNNEGFYVYRKCKYDKTYKKLGSVRNNPYETHVYKDKDFVRGINFTYKIVAYRHDSKGKITEGSSKKQSIKIAVPKTTLSSASRSGKKALLKWKKVSGASGYEIYQKNGSGSYKKVKTIKKGSTVSGSVSNVPKNSPIRFKVRAYTTYHGNTAYGSYSAVKVIQSTTKERIAKKFKKLQKLYPDGRYWNHVGKTKYNSSTTTNKPCNHITYDDISTCNHYNCPNGILGFQCYGFAWKMSDLIYGRNAKIKNFKSFAKCDMGDVIRYSGHSVIIMEKHKNYVVVGECNYGNTCIIKWGRKVYKDELGNATYSSRY